MVRHSRSRQHRAGGFTLLEAAVTTFIVSLAVLAIMSAQAAFHQSSDHAQRMTTALMLAGEVREMMLELPLRDAAWGGYSWGMEWDEYNSDLYKSIENMDDMDDLAVDFWNTGVPWGVRINPPINALRQPLPDMDRWFQQVVIDVVDPEDITRSWGNVEDQLTRVTVIVSYRAPTQADDAEPVEMTRITWVTAGKPVD